MAPKLSVLLLILSVVTVTVMAQRRRTSSSSTTTNTDEWNYRDGSEKVNMRGVANLTQILDNWSLSCLTTPDDLYKEFNALKAHLGDLTDKFSAIETFIDEVKADRANNANAGPAPGPAPGPVPRQAGRRMLKKKASS
ncbi:hypothetical protein FQN60_004249 [Etheostoma spectabile]|uniref:Uncharacterized protein n=1 Tax=Etheostoma spectabile TaxID=54343 RepID=A0A5J5CZ42_9PERO|nr:hypothetical protein FQN60_004249 [Etheostoma spectabile]